MTRIAAVWGSDKGGTQSRDANFFLKQHAGSSTEGRIEVDFLNLEPLLTALDRDLAYITDILFECEMLQRVHRVKLDEWIRFPVERSGAWNRLEVKRTIRDILSFMIKDRPDIRFVPVRRRLRPSGDENLPQSLRSMTLFSGGVDSLSGILSVQAARGPTAGVFICHTGLGNKVGLIAKSLLAEHDIQVYRVDTQRQIRVLQQLRGFLYLTLGAIVARVLGTGNVFVTESGPTMYQPSLVPTDEVTLTTHPTLVKLSKQLLRETYGMEFSFHEPFENLTKAEVISLCPSKRLMPITNSCISTAYAYSDFPHCGVCYGCLIRKLSFLVAGVPDSSYAADVLNREIGEKKSGRGTRRYISQSDLSGLLALLRFGRDIIEDRLPDFTADKIREFDKEELFRRFALDILSGLFILYGQKKVGRNSYVRKFYGACKHDGVISKETAVDRICEVREARYKPNFDYRL